MCHMIQLSKSNSIGVSKEFDKDAEIRRRMEYLEVLLWIYQQ